jgi:uncharacterized protein
MTFWTESSGHAMVSRTCMQRAYLPILAAFLVTLMASSWCFHPDQAGRPIAMSGMMFATAGLAGWAAYLAHRDELLLDWLRPRWGDLTLALLLGAGTFAAGWAFLHYVAPAGTPREAWIVGVYLQLGGPSELRGKLGFVFVGIAVASLGEEVLWRGFITTRLEPLLGSRRAWMASALLYALAHAPTAWTLRDPVAGPNPVIVLGALGLGLVNGMVFRMMGRLWPVIVAHVLFDWAAMVMFRFSGPSL